MIVTLEISLRGCQYVYDWDCQTNQVSITQTQPNQRCSTIYSRHFRDLDPLIQQALKATSAGATGRHQSGAALAIAQ